jgi:hypothetical protein
MRRGCAREELLRLAFYLDCAKLRYAVRVVASEQNASSWSMMG